MLLRCLAVIGLCTASLAWAPLPAQDPPAQSMSDLRQEIERLRQEIAQRDADLAAAKERIAKLERQLADAAAGQATGGSPGQSPTPAAPPPPFPADPSLGPGGLLAAIQAAYLAEFPTMPDTASPQKLNLHLRTLENWCARTNRDNIKQYAWTGTIDPNTFAVNGRTCSFNAVFVNGTRQFSVPVTVEQGLLSKVRAKDGSPSAAPLVFTAIVKPRIAVNSRRPTPQAFELPPMVAPYVDYLFDMEVRSVLPAPPQPAAPAAPAAP